MPNLVLRIGVRAMAARTRVASLPNPDAAGSGRWDSVRYHEPRREQGHEGPAQGAGGSEQPNANLSAAAKGYRQ